MGNHCLPMITQHGSACRGCGPNVGLCSSIFDDASSHQYGWRGQGLCPGWHGGHGGHGYWWLLQAIGYGPATSRGINVAVRHRFWRTSIMGWVIVPRISRFDHGTYVNVYTRISYVLYHILYVRMCVYICNIMQSYTAALLIDIEATKMKPCKAVSCLFLLVQNCQCKASEVTLLQQPIIRSDLFNTF